MPDWSGPIRSRLATLRLEPAREVEIVEELSQHLDERYDDLRREGAGDQEARRAALDELLDTEALADQMRPLRQAHARPSMAPGRRAGLLPGDLRQDLRYTARALRANRGFAAAAVLMLALGIGATTAIFSVVNAVLIKPLPYPDSDALYRIVHNIGGIDQQFFSDQIYVTYAENTRTFEDVGVWSPGSTATITSLGDPEEVRALRASRGILTTLGVDPAMGRWFSPVEDAPGGPQAVIITSGYWRRALGGDPAVLQRSLTIDGRPHQIVGVMPPGFRFSRDFDLVLPLRVNRAEPGRSFRLTGLARLKPGVTLEEARADASRVIDIWFARTGQSPEVRARWTPTLLPLKQDVVGDLGTTLWVLMGAIAVVLLMACANVANLLLVRANARRHELAVRAALGASVARIARQLLVESLVLALMGGALGIALAYGALRLLVLTGPANLPRLAEITIDPIALGFALAISVASGLLFGMVPIVKHARPRAAEALTAGRTAGSTLERQRSQQALVSVQMALAMVLLVSAGLMIRSFQALRSLDPGFSRPGHVQTFGISILPGMVEDRERVTRMQEEMLQRLAAIPGVEAAAFTTRVPMGSPRNSSALLIEGGQADDRRTPPNRHAKVVSPGTFRALGTPLVAGRDFSWEDVYRGHQVTIVSENLAREFWGSPSDAIGKRLREYYDDEGPWWEVVGVAANVHDDGAHQPAPASVYWPAQPLQRVFGMNGFQARRVTVVVRSERAGTEAFLDQVREAVSAVNPALPLSQISTLDEIYGQSMARTSFTLVMLAIAGAMALLLGLLGVYGVLSYAVSQRRREIGIRLALGAPARTIQRLFVRRGIVLAAIGIAIGIGAAAGLTRLMRTLLFGISPLDPLTFAVVPVLLAAATLLASYVPARRAVAMNPIETMRAE